MTSHNPWISIWSRPQATILQTIGEDPKRGLWFLATIYGFLSLLNGFQSVGLGYTLSLFPILMLAIVFAPLWGMVSFWVWSWVVYWTGKILKGQGSFVLIRASFAWSCVPLIWSIISWGIMLTLFRISLFQNFPENLSFPESQVILLFSMLVAKLVIAIWSFVIFINALAAVQQFSIARAILNILFAAIVIIAVAALIGWGVGLHAAESSLMHVFTNVTGGL